jgi:hypothetical protein
MNTINLPNSYSQANDLWLQFARPADKEVHMSGHKGLLLRKEGGGRAPSPLLLTTSHS